MSARWTGIAACSITLASLACAPAGVDDAPSVRASIDAVLRGAVERREVAGVVAVAAFPSGVFYEGAFGKRDVGDGVDMSLDSMFRLASMTKAVTSVAAMQLVDEGDLSRRLEVRHLLPTKGDDLLGREFLTIIDRINKGAGNLAPFFVGHGHHCRLRHFRVSV